MEITEEGTKVLNQLSDYFKVYKDDNHYAKHIKSTLELKKYMSYLEMLTCMKKLSLRWVDKQVIY